MPPELSFEALTPVSFLERSAEVFPDRTAVVDGNLRFTYAEFLERSQRLAGGGENISSIEVEQALAGHPSVMAVAVVGAPDDRWGEVPVAHVTLRPGVTVDERELIDYVKGRIARYKAPARIIFGELPHTSTGKIQKFMLREQHRR